MAAYVLPAAVVWGVLGLILSPLSRSRIILPVALVYAVVFGLSEVCYLPIRVPTLTWQVPAQWLQGRSAWAQTCIWGALLGPGFLTRNPYAGMWLAVLLLQLQHQTLAVTLGMGMAMGGAHGLTRAIGILYNRQRLRCDLSAVLGLLTRWRLLDGLYLLLAASFLAASVLMLHGTHP